MKMNPDADPRLPVVRWVRWSAYRIPTDGPEADGTFSWDATTLVLVEVGAGDLVGTGWTYSAAAAGHLVQELLADAVIDLPADEVGTASAAMVRAVRNVGRQGVAGTAISAVELALWDLRARLLGIRLAALLGAARDSVPVYGSGGFTTYDRARLETQLTGWVHEQAIPQVKIKIGEAWGTRIGRDLDRVRQARAVIGPQAQLYVDANGAYGTGQAIRVARQFAEYDVTWFEEPVTSDDLAGLRAVRERVDADVAAGEYGWDLTYFQRMCAAGAVDCLQADVTRCGGVSEWQRAADVAAPHHLELSGHCAPHAHLDVAAATTNVRHLEWFHDHVQIESTYFDGAVTPRSGVARLDFSCPGHGLAFKHQDAEPYRIA